MTRYHFIKIGVINDNDPPLEMWEINTKIEYIQHLYPHIIGHDWRCLTPEEEREMPFRDMTPRDLEAWFYGPQRAALSVKSIIALIKLSEGFPGYEFLKREIIPVLAGEQNDNPGNDRLAAAVILLERYLPDEALPTIVILVKRLVNALLAEQNIVERAAQEN